MATRLPEPEPWVRLSAVLAEAAGVDESKVFDAEARAQAERMRGIRWDWAGRPTCTWSAAVELLASLRAERARVLARIEEQAVAADAARRASLPAGIPVGSLPEGVSAGMLMMLSDPEHQRARRESVLEHALANGARPVYHPIQGEQ
jgi:hypothetical protein